MKEACGVSMADVGLSWGGTRRRECIFDSPSLQPIAMEKAILAKRFADSIVVDLCEKSFEL
jgi:hypothetical protein